MCKDLSKSMDKWSQIQRDLDGNIHSSEIMRSMSYLDWIMPTIINLPPMGSCLDVRGQKATFVGYKDCKDRKSTRLNSSHANISYAVFCLKKKKSFFALGRYSLVPHT